MTSVELLRLRHGALVDKKFLTGLTEAEENELAKINQELDAIEDDYFAPIKRSLTAIKEDYENRTSSNDEARI